MPRFEIGFVYTVESSVIIEAKTEAEAKRLAKQKFYASLDEETGQDVVLELSENANIVFEVLGAEPVVYCS